MIVGKDEAVSGREDIIGSQKQPRRLLLILFTVIVLLCGNCRPNHTLNGSVNQIVTPYRFNLARWEIDTLTQEINKSTLNEASSNDNAIVEEYFSIIRRIYDLSSEIENNNQVANDETNSRNNEFSELSRRKEILKTQVDTIMEKQIRETLSLQGINNPLEALLGTKITFPPVNMVLAEPPLLLVISPRERIESIREILLVPALEIETIESIEAEVSKLDVSVLVIKIGGVATYPAFVNDNFDLRKAIDVAIEEWLHHYLTFKPLGFLYLLDLTGILPNYEIATINETAVGMISKEIGDLLIEKYYSDYFIRESQDEKKSKKKNDFDFNEEMRQIRRKVDASLLAAKVIEAEEFMEERRLYLASQGYYIRKLNQAYFAFFGTYADSPTSVNPIGVELKELRNKTVSLKEYLETVAGIKNRNDLKESIN
jgi:hypothetical protein